MVDRDILAPYAAAVDSADDVLGVEEVGGFRGHAGGGRAGDELSHAAGGVSGFFEQFAASG